MEQYFALHLMKYFTEHLKDHLTSKWPKNLSEHLSEYSTEHQNMQVMCKTEVITKNRNNNPETSVIVLKH